MPHPVPFCRTLGYAKIMRIPSSVMDELIAKQESAIRLKRYNHLVEPTVIPILLAGGVGDVIMSIPVVEALSELGPIDVHTLHRTTFNYFKPPGLPAAKPLPIPPSTWLIEVNTVVRFRMMERFMGFDGPVRSLWETQCRTHDLRPRLRVVSDSHPLQDTALARYARDIGIDRREFPFFSLGIQKRPRIKWDRAKRSKKYITIHDGYESESAFIVPGRATKTWKWLSWNSLVRSLKAEFPEFDILQLGTSTGRQIEGVTHCLLEKTTLPEAFDILKGSALHIDGDSGLTHAASAMSVPCITMFGPTPAHFYGYPENVNLRSDVCADACFWLTQDWLGKCPIGYDGPKCMDEISPETVMLYARKRLNETKAPREEHPLEPSHLT